MSQTLPPIPPTPASSSTSARPLPRKSSSRNLTIVSPQGARAKPTRSATIGVASGHRHTKSTAGSRGLTVHIDDDPSIALAIQSAPVIAKALRPLPSVPPMSATATLPSVEPPSPPRPTIRPLPSVPTPASTSTTPTSTPTAPHVEPVPVANPEPTRDASPLPESLAPPPPRKRGALSMHLAAVGPPPKSIPLPIQADAQTPRVKRQAPSKPPPLSPPAKKARATPSSGENGIGIGNGGLVLGSPPSPSSLLKKQPSVALFPPSRGTTGKKVALEDIDTTPKKPNHIFLDLERSATDSEDDSPYPDVRLIIDDEEDDEEEGVVEYAWVLSNKVLYRQRADLLNTSKVILEKKGRRITQEDYENIRNALRTL